MTTSRKPTKNSAMAGDLRIKMTTRRAAGAGTWVIGTIAGHRFGALVFPEHAEYPDYELGDSRISKLWVKRLSDKQTVVNFDRGWDIRPANATAASIVEYLAGNLAKITY
jgi:hypothetical protein